MPQEQNTKGYEVEQHLRPARIGGGPRLSIVLIVLALVVFVSGTTAFLLASRHDAKSQGSTTREAIQPRSLDNGLSALREPGKDWTVTADELLPGGDFSPLHNWEGADGAENLTFSDAVIVHVSGTDDRSYLLAALDPVNGKVLWKRDQDGQFNSCYSVAENTRLLCGTKGGGQGARGTYELLQPRTGKSLGSYAGTLGDEGVDSDRDWIYLGTIDADESSDGSTNHSTTVAKLSTKDLHQAWRVTAKDPGPDKNQGDDFDAGVLVTSDSGKVHVSYGYLDWTLDTESGKQTAFSSDQEGGYSYFESGYRINDDYVGQQSRTQVTDAEGNAILDVPGSAWPTPDFNAPRVNNGRLGIDGALYDLSTGKPIWSHDKLQPADGEADTTAYAAFWSPRGDQVMLDRTTQDPDTEDTQGVTSLIDADSGNTVWERDVDSTDDPVAWTEDALVTIVGTDLQVWPRNGDSVAWHKAVDDLAPPATDQAGYALGVSDQTVVAISDAAVRGYTDFPADGLESRTSDAAGKAGTKSQDGGTDYVTACGSEPEFTPTESEAANGGITITFEVHAVCPSGGWLNASGQRVILTGDAEETYAAAVFDFSTNPYWIPGKEAGSDPTTIRLTFAYDTVFSTTSELADVIKRKVVMVKCDKEAGSHDGTVPTDPSYGADDSIPVQASGPSQAVDTEKDALEALKRIAVTDSDAVAALEGRWVPQLSSKKRGTTDDGIVYSYSDILAEHLRLQARYPAALLVNSDDYKSFLVPGYWVTLVGTPSNQWRPALQWCPDNGFDKDHCYAKRLLRDGPPEGATKHLDSLKP